MVVGGLTFFALFLWMGNAPGPVPVTFSGIPTATRCAQVLKDFLDHKQERHVLNGVCVPVTIPAPE